MNHDKKIVFLIIGFFNGGLERRVTNLSNEFVKNGYAVDIVAVRGGSTTPFFELDEGVKIVEINERKNTFRYADFSQKLNQSVIGIETGSSDLDYYRELSTGGNSLKKRIRKAVISLWKKSVFLRRVNSKRFSAVYKDYFRRAKPDIVVSFGVSFHEHALAAVKGLKCKLFDAEINAHQSVIPQDRVGQRYYSNLMKQFDGIIVQTQSEKEYFQKRFKNVYVINNPVMPGLPHPYSGERKKVIVNFCRMTPQKNLSVLLEAFQKFHNEYPEYILKIFGNTQEKAEAEEKNKLVGRISDLKLADCAFILPPVPDVHEKIIDSAMFVSSSDYEGLSNTMLEAMAIGLPCVCTDCLGGGTREVMVDHENGLIVPMKDPESMYRAMKEYVENQELAEKCSMNAARIRDRLSVEKITQQWLDVIEG